MNILHPAPEGGFRPANWFTIKALEDVHGHEIRREDTEPKTSLLCLLWWYPANSAFEDIVFKGRTVAPNREDSVLNSVPWLDLTNLRQQVLFDLRLSMRGVAAVVR